MAWNLKQVHPDTHNQTSYSPQPNGLDHSKLLPQPNKLLNSQFKQNTFILLSRCLSNPNSFCPFPTQNDTLELTKTFGDDQEQQ